ncbi:hypothetical protein [Agarivorans gilvus]|nr:hypothetical protein [Agarivorans gilvus]
MLVALLWVYILVNYLICRHFNRSNISDAKITKWAVSFYLQLVLLAWLFNAIFFYLELEHVDSAMLYLILVSVGYSAGAVTAYHQLKWAPPVFIASALVPQMAYYLLPHSQNNPIMASMLLFIFAFLSMISLEQHKNWIAT